LSLYLYNHVLALFSAVPYVEPTAQESESGEPSHIDLAPHLTNTALQTHRGEQGVRLLEELVGCQTFSGLGYTGNAKLTTENVENIVNQMAKILAETFKAALEMPIHFQPLQNAFELYGVDFLVTVSETSGLQVKLLEINAEPAIELTGPRLTWILEDLFVAIRKACVEPFFSIGALLEAEWAIGETRHGLIKCLDEEVRHTSG